MKLLHKAPNIEIYSEHKTRILLCNWLGYQDEESLQNAGLIIHKLFIEHRLSKILNDNSDVVGPWNHSTEWATKEWFPSMIEAGLKKFAWVFANDIFAQLSANRVIPTSPVIRSFTSRDAAYQWLTEQSPS